MILTEIAVIKGAMIGQSLCSDTVPCNCYLSLHGYMRLNMTNKKYKENETLEKCMTFIEIYMRKLSGAHIV